MKHGRASDVTPGHPRYRCWLSSHRASCSIQASGPKLQADFSGPRLWDMSMEPVGGSQTPSPDAIVVCWGPFETKIPRPGGEKRIGPFYLGPGDWRARQDSNPRPSVPKTIVPRVVLCCQVRD